MAPGGDNLAVKPLLIPNNNNNEWNLTDTMFVCKSVLFPADHHYLIIIHYEFFISYPD